MRTGCPSRGADLLMASFARIVLVRRNIGLSNLMNNSSRKLSHPVRQYIPVPRRCKDALSRTQLFYPFTSAAIRSQLVKFRYEAVKVPPWQFADHGRLACRCFLILRSRNKTSFFKSSDQRPECANK